MAEPGFSPGELKAQGTHLFTWPVWHQEGQTKGSLPQEMAHIYWSWSRGWELLCLT